MSRLNRKQLKKLLLKEFKMMGMAPMGAVGDTPLGMHGHSSDYGMDEDYLAPAEHHGMHGVDHGGHKGALSMEDCCKAVLCLIECCDCEITKQKIRECCEGILASC